MIVVILGPGTAFDNYMKFHNQNSDQVYQDHLHLRRTLARIPISSVVGKRNYLALPALFPPANFGKFFLKSNLVDLADVHGAIRNGGGGSSHGVHARERTDVIRDRDGAVMLSGSLHSKRRRRNVDSPVVSVQT